MFLVFVKRPTIMKFLYFILLFFFIVQNKLFAQNISKDSLSKHAYYLASDELQGRALGTVGKEKATTYISNQFQKIGLQPYKGS